MTIDHHRSSSSMGYRASPSLREGRLLCRGHLHPGFHLNFILS